MGAGVGGAGTAEGGSALRRHPRLMDGFASQPTVNRKLVGKEKTVSFYFLKYGVCSSES